MSSQRACLVLALALAASASAQDVSSVSTQSYAGQWSAQGDAPADTGNTGAPPGPGSNGGGRRGDMHGGGHTGMGGEGAGGGRHHSHDRAAPGASSNGAAGERESSDPALERLFARQVTITALDHPRRMRFDTGTHAVDLSTDGGNVSGPGVGGTVALTVEKGALVVDSLSDSGYVVKERYLVTDDGRRLEMHATLRKGDGPEREIVRVFAHPLAKAPAAAH